MKRIVLLMVLFLFVTECGVIEGLGYSPLKVENISMGGDFLFNHGGRLYFTPSCYYKKERGDIQCGLSALGFGTHYTRGYNLDGERNEVLFNPRDSVSHEYLRFDKLMVEKKNDSTRSILNYLSTSNFANIYPPPYYFSGEEVSDFRQYLNSSAKIDFLLIESDLSGLVDFSLRDANGTKIHIKYDMSHFMQGIRDSVTISDSGIEFAYKNENFMWYEMKNMETCFTKPLKKSSLRDSSFNGEPSVVLANSAMDQCRSFCENEVGFVDDINQWWHENGIFYDAYYSLGFCSYLGEIRLAVLPSDSRDSIIECESSKNIDDECVIDPEPDDMALPNSKRTYLRKLYKSFCKGVAIVPIEMNDNLDESCNFFYRYRED